MRLELACFDISWGRAWWELTFVIVSMDCVCYVSVNCWLVVLVVREGCGTLWISGVRDGRGESEEGGWTAFTF